HGLRGIFASARFNSKISMGTQLSLEFIHQMYALFWLGISAIALGTATSAYRKAYLYAQERYQRGGRIRDIESVQMLLGTSKAKIEVARNALFNIPFLDAKSLVHFAAALKLTINSLCTEAVSDCLQIFGGYGYMEDFGIEKKYRDVHTLATIGGSALFLKHFIAQMEYEGS
ncbi:MAG: acyl-CoA dehydrogenase family protein, partial [Spirochaetes bacterium]|nr:acyl-CoA dehydrogenase family protein [Spirochaetota bacterium]